MAHSGPQKRLGAPASDAAYAEYRHMHCAEPSEGVVPEKGSGSRESFILHETYYITQIRCAW
jgi:hypothetical protein